MIVDLVVGLLDAIVRPVLSAIPTVDLHLPDPSVIGGYLSNLDTLLPVLGPLRLIVALLSLVVVFMGVRALLMLRYVLLP